MKDSFGEKISVSGRERAAQLSIAAALAHGFLFCCSSGLLHFFRGPLVHFIPQSFPKPGFLAPKGVAKAILLHLF